MVVLDRQQLVLAGCEPAASSVGLALWAVPVSVGVVGDVDVFAGLAAQRVSSQRRAAALLDGRHDLELAQAYVATPCVPPSRAVDAEDVRDFQAEALYGTPYTRYI